MKITITVESKKHHGGDLAESLRGAASTLRLHGVGPFGYAMIGLAVAEALEKEAERIEPRTEDRWDWL